MLTVYLEKLREKQNLTTDEAAGAMEAIMSGTTDPAQIEEYLIQLADKGETADEIAGSAIVMREHAIRIHPRTTRLIDVCGTGGDGTNTFNISTTVAFVVAGAGVAVAKHGNRAISSQSGSANVLEELGVKIDFPPEKVEQEINKIGIGFMFAPLFHPAMKFVAPIRQKLGRRTIFNILGPLTNPAGTLHQVIGVFEPSLTRLLAETLKKMGHEHALVVHGRGLDEFTTTGISQVAELKNGTISEYEVNPESLRLPLVEIEDLTGGDAIENAKITKKILEGESGSRRNIVLLNSAAALLAADEVKNLEIGLEIAAKSIDSGAAKEKLTKMIEFSPTA